MMRGHTVKFVLCMLAAALAWTAPAPAAGRTGKRKPSVSRPDADKAYSLDDIMKAPKEYLEREVFFYCRYASSANFFKNVNTRFNASEHTNFAVWPDKAVLWEPEGRKSVVPTLYVSKRDPATLEMLRGVKKYELIAITGYVLNVYAGHPWILVTKIERVETPQDSMSDQVVEHMQAGYDALSKNFGGVAARHFEQAIQFGLPAEYVATAYKQLAFAYHIDNQLDKAQDYLRMAVECNPADPLLHLALADVSLRMGDAEEALAHCVFAMERSGRYPQTYGIMGEAKSLSGDYVKAFADLNAAGNTPGITPREGAMVKVRRARIYNRAERYTDAAQVYAAVSEPGEPLSGEPWLLNEVGLFYESLFLKSGDARYLDGAAEAYAEAVRLSRFNDASILYNQAEAEFRRQSLSGDADYSKVRELIGEINKVEPEFPAARILEGRTLYAEGKIEEAEQRYQTVARLIGDDALALMSLAEAYHALGRHSEAADVMRRARGLQPWNLRLKAVGEFIEAKAPSQAVETASPGYETIQSPEGKFNGYPTEPQSGEDAFERTPSTQYPIAAPAPRRWETSPPDAYGAPGRGTAAGAPDYRSAPSGGETYRLDGRLITVRPGESIRVSTEGWAKTEPTAMYPQEIQASAMPAPSGSRPGKSHPVAEVNIESLYPQRPSAAEQVMRRNGALDLGYTPASEPPEQEEIPEFHFDPQVGDSGVASENALASLPARAGRKTERHDGRLPPFTFAPDGSPALIVEFRAPNRDVAAMPIRNANLFRRVDGGRQPAEIIEKEPVPTSVAPDASAMTPPDDGAVRRAEVTLPSSAVGVGMTSDYK